MRTPFPAWALMVAGLLVLGGAGCRRPPPAREVLADARNAWDSLANASVRFGVASSDDNKLDLGPPGEYVEQDGAWGDALGFDGSTQWMVSACDDPWVITGFSPDGPWRGPLDQTIRGVLAYFEANADSVTSQQTPDGLVLSCSYGPHRYVLTLTETDHFPQACTVWTGPFLEENLFRGLSVRRDVDFPSGHFSPPPALRLGEAKHPPPAPAEGHTPAATDLGAYVWRFDLSGAKVTPWPRMPPVGGLHRAGPDSQYAQGARFRLDEAAASRMLPGGLRLPDAVQRVGDAQLVVSPTMTLDIGVHLQTQDGQSCALWVNYSGSVTRLVGSVALGTPGLEVASGVTILSEPGVVRWPDPSFSTPIGFSLYADEMSEADLLRLARSFVDAYQAGPGLRQPTEGLGVD